MWVSHWAYFFFAWISQWFHYHPFFARPSIRCSSRPPSDLTSLVATFLPLNAIVICSWDLFFFPLLFPLYFALLLPIDLLEFLESHRFQNGTA